MTRSEFAEVTGLGEATLGRWETGALVQNRANDRYLRLMREPRTMDILQRLSVERSESIGNGGTATHASDKVIVLRHVDPTNEWLRNKQRNFQLHRQTVALAS